MLENCNFSTGAIIVLAPGQTLSQGLVSCFEYDDSDDFSFIREVESSIRDIRKEIRSSDWCEPYRGKTLAVFSWHVDYTSMETATFYKFIKIQNVAEFKL